MKTLLQYFLPVFLLVFSLKTIAQSCINDRYQKEIFTTTYIQDLRFVQGVPNLNSPYLSQSNTSPIDLYMDVHLPDTEIATGNPDTLSKRPVMIWAHGGSFLNPGKEDDDMQAMIDTFARRGYVTASIQYRLGFNVLDIFGDPDSAERAVYRAVQDGGSAIRFFKENADVFKIDTSKIFFGGNSAGSIVGVILGYAQESERPPTTFNSPDLGGPYIFPVDKYSSIDPPVYSNQAAAIYNYNPAAVINMWGATGDTLWITPGIDTTPIISFHGDEDNVIDINVGSPFGVPWFPEMYGSIPISIRANNLGIHNELHIYEGYDHVTYDGNSDFENGQPDDPANWVDIITKASIFIYDLMKPTAPVLVSGAPIVGVNSTHTYSVTNAINSSNYCWDISGGSIVNQSSNSDWVDIMWTSTGTGTISVKETNACMVDGEFTMMSVTINCATDSDGDGVCDDVDNCVADSNASQADLDGDGIGDTCDPENLIACNATYFIPLVYNAGDTLKYEASNYILGYNDINAGAKIEYDAQNYIILNDGFNALSGSEFRAYIDGCGNAKNENTPPNTPEKLIANTQLFPNPNNGTFTIKNTSGISEIRVIDIMGRVIQNQSFNTKNNSTESVQINDLPKGQFWVQVVNGEGGVDVREVVVF